jgi:membrane protein DedA with SNARE-associated domain
MPIETILGYIVTYRYILIIPITIIEGPIIMVLCGFLIRFGTFDLIPIYATLVISDLVGDIGWYCVGRFWGLPFVQRFGKFFSITEKTLAKATALFHKHHNKILFISKITMGFGFAVVTLITAGIAKVPFKKYLAFNVSGQFIWTAVLLAVGYGFGNIYTSIDKGFRDVALVAIIIIALVVVYGFGKYISKRIGEKL